MRRLHSAVLLLGLFAVSCKDSPTDSKQPPVLTAVSGDNTTATVNTDVTVGVKVTSSSNAPLAGVTVTWSVSSGGGTISASSTTGADGVATATWHFGTTAGVQKAAATTSTAGSPTVTFTGNATAGPVSTIVVTPSSANIISGAVTVLQVATTDSYGNAVANPAVTWSSQNESVATVAAGVVTGRLVGDATIVAKVGAVQGTAVVHVAAGAAVGFSITPSPVALSSFGETVQLTAALRDAAGNPLPTGTIAWSSSDASAVGVSSTGLVTAYANGQANINASTGAYTATTAATVSQKLAQIKMNALTLYGTGARKALNPSFTDARGNVMAGAATYTTSDAAIATVDGSGNVTAVGGGTAVITATSGTVTGTVNVRVVLGAATLETVSFNDTVIVNQPGVWNLIPRNDDGGSVIVPIEVTSSDTTIVLVAKSDSAPARATYFGRKTGRATLTARSGDATLTRTVEVTEGGNIRAYPHDNIDLHGIGTTQQITLKSMHGTTLDTYTGPVTWTSSNPQVASVSADGLITANSVGVAAISFDAPSLSIPGFVQVTVSANNGLYLTNSVVDLGGVWGNTYQLRALDGVGPLTWQSSDTTVVRVNAAGVLDVVAPGSATITVTDGVKTATTNVTTFGPTKTINFAVTPWPVMLAGTAFTPEPQAFDVNGSNMGGLIPTLTSSDPSVIRVFGKYIFALKRGTATITAAADGVTKSFTVEVQ